jgi:hypothetical protein
LRTADFSDVFAGDLFHFWKDQGVYIIEYPEKPLVAAGATTDNRLLSEFFLLVLQDVHERQSLGALEFTSD